MCLGLLFVKKWVWSPLSIPFDPKNLLIQNFDCVQFVNKWVVFPFFKNGRVELLRNN